MTTTDEMSDDCRTVLLRAQDEARVLGHGYIGTEHLLIAVLSAGDGPGVAEARRQGASPDAARQLAIAVFDSTENANRYVSNEEALQAVGVDIGEVRRIAETQFGPGAVPMRVGNPPFTPRARDALQRAGSRAGSRSAIRIEDILLGLLADPESVASQFLERTCSNLARVRQATESDPS